MSLSCLLGKYTDAPHVSLARLVSDYTKQEPVHYALSLQYCPIKSVNIYLEDSLFSNRRLLSYLVSVSGALGLPVLIGFKLDLLCKGFEGFFRRVYKPNADFNYLALVITIRFFSFCPLTTSFLNFFITLRMFSVGKRNIPI